MQYKALVIQSTYTHEKDCENSIEYKMYYTGKDKRDVWERIAHDCRTWYNDNASVEDIIEAVREHNEEGYDYVVVFDVTNRECEDIADTAKAVIIEEMLATKENTSQPNSAIVGNIFSVFDIESIRAIDVDI